jgi:hypothetical protein
MFFRLVQGCNFFKHTLKLKHFTCECHHRERKHTHTQTCTHWKSVSHHEMYNVSCTKLDGFTVNTQLLELYKAWSKSIWSVFISLVPYITLCWDFSESVLMCSCISSNSKTSMQPFSLMQSPQVNTGDCVMPCICDDWEHGIMHVNQILYKTYRNRKLNLWYNVTAFQGEATSHTQILSSLPL